MPQPTTRATLYIKNSSSSNNYRLFSYLKGILPQTMRVGLYIDHRIADTADAEYFKEQNIYGFPALILNHNVYVGNQEIEACLNGIIRRPPHDDDDDVNNFLLKAVTTNADGSKFVAPKARGIASATSQQTLPNEDDEDENETESKKLQSQIQQALRDRQARDKNFGKGMNEKKKEIASTQPVITRPRNPDDALLNKLYENQGA